MDKVRLGIIGFGKMGSQHGKYLTKGDVPNACLTAVADTDPARLDAAKKLCGDSIRTFSTAHDLIESGSCDAIIISTPHYFHPVYGMEGLKAGLHVYTKQVEELNHTAEQSGKVFGVMFNQRTNPLYQKLRDLIQSGELGEIKRTIASQINDAQT